MAFQTFRTLDVVQTLGFAAVVLLVGHLLRKAVPPLARYNLPIPVVGGLLYAVIALMAKRQGMTLLSFDETLRVPLMIAFFTTIGFGASVGLLKRGGPQVLILFGLVALVIALQNVLGAALAVATGQPPLFGVLCGSVTLAGGPGTAAAFAESFEKTGIEGAAEIGITAATAGIVIGGVLGGPLGTFLVERLRRRPGSPSSDDANMSEPHTAAGVVESKLPLPAAQAPMGEDAGAYVLLKSVGVILIAMWAGHWLGVVASTGVTLPAYIGAMLVAALIRNLDDATGFVGLSQRTLDQVGEVSLAFFLAMTLMALDLSRLAAVAGPLLVIVAFQTLLVAAVCLWPVFPWMGRDYDAAVMSGGFYGFMMGTTANAMANMDALARRYGPAPRAFLVVPLVGAFFLDFANALLIQASLWLVEWAK